MTHVIAQGHGIYCIHYLVSVLVDILMASLSIISCLCGCWQEISLLIGICNKSIIHKEMMTLPSGNWVDRGESTQALRETFNPRKS